VERHALDDPEDDLLQRRVDLLEPLEQLVKAPLDPRHRDERDLGPDAADSKLFTAEVVGSPSSHSVGPVHGLPDRNERLLRRELVDIEDEVKIRVEVGVAAARGACQQRRLKRHPLERGVDQRSRKLAKVMGRRGQKTGVSRHTPQTPRRASHISPIVT
jgi:hypothetical protein